MKSPLVIDGEHDYLCFFPLGSLISLPPPEMIPEEVSISDSCSSVFSEFIFNATVEDMCHVTSRFSYGDQGDESLFEIRLLKKKKRNLSVGTASRFFKVQGASACAQEHSLCLPVSRQPRLGLSNVHASSNLENKNFLNYVFTLKS